MGVEGRGAEERGSVDRSRVSPLSPQDMEKSVLFRQVLKALQLQRRRRMTGHPCTTVAELHNAEGKEPRLQKT